MNKEKVLITGASSGIGLTCAIYLTYKGYKVIGTSRHPEKLNNDLLKNRYLEMLTKYTITHLKSSQETLVKGKIQIPDEIFENLDNLIEKIEFKPLDVTNSNSVSEIIPLLMAEGVRIIVNNAGSGFFGPIETLSIDHSKEQLDLNYFGQIRVIQNALPYMRNDGGIIVNMASLGGYIPLPFHSHYSSSKSALRMLTETLRLELQPFNIKVVSLNPGVINTPFNVNMHTPKAGSGPDSYDYQEENSITTLKKLLNALPTPKESPYYSAAKQTWETVVRNMIRGPSPQIVAEKLYKIITSKNPKVHYISSNFIQRFGYFLMRRITSDKLKIFITRKFYGI
ncbi:SDR family oxidoreductase [Promethearchaeum syntrophicum]|uniref:SDR family oxidoreductase n=1 Tax=Promethearchaeum syntrophicum TaxID=2594042 RepID=A0A5B9D952_9ARCH|nr:SDR family oxidoreductase [Candidatus Prometheoarchaeum syntrophicum]QEE15551.1 short chain dehydrogenase [Candidatus Prometheoarchaeum syntrophicum]